MHHRCLSVCGPWKRGKAIYRYTHITYIHIWYKPIMIFSVAWAHIGRFFLHFAQFWILSHRLGGQARFVGYGPISGKAGVGQRPSDNGSSEHDMVWQDLTTAGFKPGKPHDTWHVHLSSLSDSTPQPLCGFLHHFCSLSKLFPFQTPRPIDQQNAFGYTTV